MAAHTRERRVQQIPLVAMRPTKVRACLRPARLRAAFWALRARRIARRVVWAGDLTQPVELPPSPAVPADAVSAVAIVLRYTRATCLVSSLVMQHWLRDHGEMVDVVIGVTSPRDGFRAHAWLDRPGDWSDDYTEVHRLRGDAFRRAHPETVIPGPKVK